MRLRYSMVAALALASCDARRAEQRQPPPAAPAPPAAAADTVAARPRAFYQALVSQDTATAPRFQPVEVAGQRYQLYTSAVADSAQPLQKIYRNRVNSVDDNGREVRVTRQDTVRGYEVQYRFRLRDAAGRSVFDQTLRKTRELAAALGEDFVTDTDAFRPRYLGYLPAFGSLAFLVYFGPEGTDVGGELLLLLDARTGRLRHAGVSQWFLGANNPETPQLSADGQALLTSYELLRADGGAVSFRQPRLSVGGAAWLSEQAVLVTYAPELDSLGERPRLSGPNNRVLDRQGRELTRFQLDLVSNEVLGYSWLYRYLPATRTHYFVDLPGGRLALIGRDAPAQPRLVPLRSLPRFSGKPRPSEQRLQLVTEEGSQLVLLADTVSGALRYRLKKP